MRGLLSNGVTALTHVIGVMRFVTSYRSSTSRATATMCIDVHLFHCLGLLGAPQLSPRSKTASEVAPGRQELPLSMRLSLWSGWVREQLVCPNSLDGGPKWVTLPPIYEWAQQDIDLLGRLGCIS